ncbi:MAG: beta-galactosidase [Ardenticatenaceae bacterium]|nr:beta-galactosidase [Ardenticatenaceae bacterium]
MRNFYAKGGQFWLDEQPQLIQAGEFHYFRTPKEEWAHRLGLLQQAGFNTVACYIPWLWHQTEEGVTDVNGRSHPMRDLAGFLDLATEMGLLIIPRPGPYIMAETINEGVPPWVFANYPQVAFVSQDEKVQNIVSYLHPDFLACVKDWYTAVFEVLTPRQVTHGGNIIMIQLDNEMGMPHWVRNIFDTNPDTIARFAKFVGEKYGRSLSQRYPTDNLEQFLRTGLMHPAAPQAAHIVDDYRHFYRDYMRDYMAFLWDTARANGMNVPPVVNIHGFMNGGKTFPIGLSQLIKVMEMDGMISATDVYPIFIGEGNFHQLLFVNETTKALQNKDQALFSIEFQAGGNNDFSSGQSSFYDLHTRLCISTGMRAINHYLFFDGENDPVLSPVKRHNWGHPVRKDGTLRQHYHRYPKTSSVLHAYGTDLVLAQPQNVTTIGFLLDDFMTEINNSFTQDATRVITHQREVVLCDFIARGLALTHRPFDMVELTRTSLDVSQTPLLWMMMEKQCPAEVQQKLVDYVKLGGKLVLAGRLCEADFNGEPCTILKDALGVKEIESDPPFVQTRLTVFNHTDVPASFVESYSGNFAEVLATRANGKTVGFVQAVGRGSVLFFGAALSADTLEDLDIVHQMANRMGCTPQFQLSSWADVRLSEGANGRFLFLNNYLDDPVDTTVAYQNSPLFNGRSIHLPARQGLILPLEWQLNDDILVHYTTGEITGITEEGDTIVLSIRPSTATAEMSVGNKRQTLHTSDGRFVLQRGPIL